MVQIRRTKQSLAKSCQTKCIRCLRYVAISAVIPAVFVLRFHYFGNSASNMGAVRIRSSGTASSADAAADDDASVAAQQQQQQQRRYQTYIAFLERVDYSIEHNLHGSDVVELHHCNVKKAITNWTDFIVTSDPLLQGAMEALKQPLLAAVGGQQGDTASATSAAAAAAAVAAAAMKDMQEEFLLELLEQYISTTQPGLCDYAKYRPSVVGHAAEGDTLRQVQQPIQLDERQRDNDVSLLLHNDHHHHRLAIVISAFRDVNQLAALLEAVHQPQHYIVIHLERNAPVEYRAQVEALILRLRQETTTTAAHNHHHYENVVIVQFGTVVYRTDSLSMINLRVLRWLTIDLNLGYEHAVLLDGSAYALQSASELVATLQQQQQQQQLQSGRSVWLGELTHNGQRVSSSGSTPPAFDHLLKHKRLIFTRNTSNSWKLHKRLPKQASAAAAAKEGGNIAVPLSSAIRDHLIYKSTSGNQGIYSRNVIEQLLNSDTVMELFALSKYGCCCCLEERNWIAALSMIGYAKEALEQTSMFQVWGGETTCGGSMNNAVLSVNATLCYRSEDPGHRGSSSSNSSNSNNNNNNATTTGADHYFYGDSTWEYLVDAKRRGFLFARKFQSDSAASMELMREIQSKLWKIPDGP